MGPLWCVYVNRWTCVIIAVRYFMWQSMCFLLQISRRLLQAGSADVWISLWGRVTPSLEGEEILCTASVGSVPLNQAQTMDSTSMRTIESIYWALRRIRPEDDQMRLYRKKLPIEPSMLYCHGNACTAHGCVLRYIDSLQVSLLYKKHITQQQV